MSESANQDGEGHVDALDEPAPSEQPLGPTRAAAKTGLLAELLEGAAEPTSPREPAPVGSPASPMLGTRVGWLVEWASGAAPTVDYEGNELGPLAARSVIPLDPTLVAEAIAERRGVMLTFEDGRADARTSPIITGLLQPVVFEVDADAEADAGQLVDGISALHASVDGQRVEIEAADEIVLRCGEASIVLRRNGRVVIRGTYVETRSRGVNRIKGGSVQIN